MSTLRALTSGRLRLRRRQRERAARIDRLVPADQLHVLHLDAIVAVAYRGRAARRRSPLDPLGPHRERRQVNLLVVRVEDDVAARVDLAILLLCSGLEVELRVLVRGRRRDLVQLERCRP